MEQNILVPGFDDDSKAYQAFSVLKHSAAQGRIELEDGVVVERAVESRHTKFDEWRVAQKQRLSRLGARVKHAFARTSA